MKKMIDCFSETQWNALVTRSSNLSDVDVTDELEQFASIDVPTTLKVVFMSNPVDFVEKSKGETLAICSRIVKLENMQQQIARTHAQDYGIMGIYVPVVVSDGKRVSRIAWV